MKPAFSVIFFTVVSGCGYGLLFLLGVVFVLDPLPIARNEALLALAIGAAFVVAGLLSSTLHLGQPQRAWRAFSQWRSSWLSREGVASVASFVPIFALAWCLWRGADAGALRVLGAALAVLAVVTVACTARIYTCLKTIPAWCNAYVLPGYLMFGLLGGACWLWLIAALTHSDPRHYLHQILPPAIVAIAIVGVLIKSAYWKHIDAAPPASTPESATGLGRFGAVRSVEAPHTEENYLTQEMGFVLARKHAARLRTICLVLISAMPILAAAALLALPGSSAVLACIAALAVTAGLFVERWLFFAQAKHVVMLYYGSTRPQNP
jgi:DMSO reductase anchor subunit